MWTSLADVSELRLPTTCWPFLVVAVSSLAIHESHPHVTCIHASEGRESPMSPSRKPSGPRGLRRSHAHRRHDRPAPAETAHVPITFDGRYLGELHVRPGTDEDLLARAIDQIATLTEWSKLGACIAALGPHRLAIAARAARAAVSGGRGVGTEEEEQIAQWFIGIVDEAIHRGGLRAAAAIWVVLVSDSHPDPFEVRAPRCPAVAEIPYPPRGFAFEPGEPDGMVLDRGEVATFLAKLRAAAAGYLHTVIAGASPADILELREIVRADDDTLEDYRPWGVDFAAEEPASESLENARSMLTCRHLTNAEACYGFADWAHGFAGMVAEHTLPPVFRVGAIAWLARVALRPEEGAA